LVAAIQQLTKNNDFKMKKRKERELLFYLIQDRAQRAVLLLKEDSRFDFSPSQI